MSSAFRHPHLVQWNAKDLDAVAGFFQPVTGSIDWCETNYQVSYYVAEWYNALTNFAFFYLALRGIRNALDQKLGIRYVLSWIGLAIVGIGSFGFHTTLHMNWQLADELPMLLLTAQLCYLSLETSTRNEPDRGGIALPISLAVGILSICLIYIRNGNAVFHQVAWGCLVVITTGHSAYMLRRLDNTPAESIRRKDISGYVKLGTVLFLLAFASWNIDNLLCEQLQPYKAMLGSPFSALLEGHAWWHIGTGLGSYNLIMGTQLLSLTQKEGPEAFEQPSGLLPLIQRTAPLKKLQ